MKLSFLPGDLYLSNENGLYVVLLKGEEILRTQSQRVAVTRFNQLRQEMELQFPNRELTTEEKKGLLEKFIADSLVGDNSRREPRKPINSTRTFG